MDHNGLYTDLDSFSSITNNNSFNDTCPTLPSLNNFKYQQTNLSTNIYQQPVQTIHDQQQQQQHNHSAKSSSALPQTQININNCNNNIFFPHDDGIFDTNTSATQCASTNVPNSGNNQKNNFVGYVHRKETGASGGGGDNITYNINNINTNIVNNINNPTNSVGSTDIFGGNQYHQINKNGETIINFTNNNLNSGGNSMPTDTVSATSQNYYGYQTNNNGQGQQTVYETSVQSQSQSQSSSTFLDPSGVPKSMGTTGTTGLYHGHHHNQGPLNQTMTNGSYLSGNANTIPPEHSSVPSTVDPFSEYPETLSTAKIINNFESKNPLKYQSSNRMTGTYYKNASDYYPPVGHLQHHNYPGLYPNANGIPKMPSHTYEPYPRISPRSNVPHYPAQHYPTPPNAHAMDEHTANRLSYNRTSAGPVHAPVPPYHHPHSLPPHPSNNYGNYYSNGYGTMPYSTYPQMPGPPYVNPLMRNESCSKSSTNYSKTGAVALSPVEHGNFSMPHASNYPAPKKDFFNENHFFPPHHFYDDQVNSVLNSCAKKPSSRSKVNHDIYNPNGTSTIYPDPHAMPHHQQNTNVIRNVNYQPMPKHSYPMPTNSCDLNNPYHSYNFHPYKNVEHQKMQKINPAMSSKQFKNYSHFEQLAHPPHISYSHQPQYHTMQAKHPEKMKLSIDLEEQINSSKIPKMRDIHHPAYGFDPHHPHHYFPYHHHMPSRNPVNDDPSKNPIANINISLRDFLSTWNEIDDDEESSERRQPNGAMEDLTEHMERTIMREYNPMFVQKATDSFMSASDLPSHNAARSAQLSELESGIISEGTEKLYVLESIDVPLSELNKYKHLSVINKLPENVVINDKELYADVDGSMKFIEEIDLTREKLYKSEFELEFEACQERKISKPVEDIPKVIVPSKVVENIVIAEAEPKQIEPEIQSPEPKKSDSEDKEKVSQKKKTLKEKAPKVKSSVKLPKIRQNILKLKKEKILKESKVRITKRVKKYSLNQRTSSVKSLQSICVDLLNTSGYRNFAREQLSIINKVSKMRILKDFKKKFNFEGTKKSTHPVNQKFNHSVRINSLREICGKLLSDQSKMLEIHDDEENEETAQSNEVSESENYGNFPTLKEICKNVLTEMDIDVVEDDYIYSPTTLKELCESFIYSNRQYFLIEEVSNIPKLQDLCKNVLSETNIFINIDEENEEIFALNDEPEETLESNSIVDNADGEPIYIVEENSGSVGELFESENLNSFERSEILRKIQRVASIEDDEIFQAIGALHRDDDDVELITNNNNSNVSNRNIRVNGNCSESNEFSATNEEMKFESEMSFMSYMDDDLMHSVQYEEIISVKGDEASNKIVEILRHKHLNRSDERQASKAIRKILKKALIYQRTHRFCNAKRRDQINALKLQARAALLKLKESKTCDNTFAFTETISSTTETSSQQESENESQTYAKEDDTKAQLHQKLFYDEATPTIIDDSPADDCFDSIDSGAERNFPKLPSVLPSINEYKIDRKSSNRSDVKDICEAKRRKLTFDESLLSIDKMYGENVEENHERRNSDRRSSSSSSHNNNHRSSHRHEKQRHHSSRHSSSRRSKRSRSRERDSKTQKSYHNSSRHNFYNNDQMKHSETKRLVIPSYKLYDKDLDIKLKTMPYVRIEREERVDDMVKKYN